MPQSPPTGPPSELVRWLRRLADPVADIAAINLWLPSLLYAAAVYFPLASALLLQRSGRALPPPPEGALEFVRLVWRPEPMELPVYVAGYVVIPLLAALMFLALRALVPRRQLVYHLVRHWPLAAVAVLAAAVAFKLAIHALDLKVWQQFGPRGEAKLQLLVLVALAAGAVAYLRRVDVAAVWRRVELANLWRWRWWFFAALALVMFDPNFTYDHHHYGYFIGVLNGLRHGRWLLVDLAWWYGFNPLGLLGLFTLTGAFSYAGLNFVLQLVEIASAVSGVYLVRRFTGSAPLAYLIGFAFPLVRGLSLLSLDANQVPVNGALRHVFFYLLVWLWVSARRWQPAAVAAALGLSAVGFFWFPDTGAYLAVATLATVALLAGGSGVRATAWVRRTVGAIAALAAGIGLVAAAYSLLAWRAVGQLPDWSQYFAVMGVFSRGFALFPLPPFGFFQIYVAATLVTLLAVLWRRWVAGRPLPADAVALFVAAYSALQLIYYIGRSYSANLTDRQTFLLLLMGVWWYGQYLRAPKPVDATLGRAASALAVTLLVLGAVLFPLRLRATFAARDYARSLASFTAETIGRPEVYSGTSAVVLDDIAVLRRDYAAAGSLALLHPWDAKILFELDLGNALPLYEFTAPLTEAELDAAIAAVRTQRPARLFIVRTDTPMFQAGFAIYQDRVEYVWRGVEDLYVPERTLKTMTVYRLR